MTWPLAREFGAVKVVADVIELADDELDLIIDFAGVGTHDRLRDRVRAEAVGAWSRSA